MREDLFAEFILDQLAPLRGVRSRRLFGGHGLYLNEEIFAIIHQGRLYLWTDEELAVDYRARGLECFRPSGKHTLYSYYETPAELTENPALLLDWCRRSIAARNRNRVGKLTAKPKSPGRRPRPVA